MNEPEIVVGHREQLLYLLTEAAEIEHGLMCCYLYAVFSLKRDDPGWSDEERAAVGRWRQALVAVARDEMTHLALVSNLMVSLGSAPHYLRSNFPVSAGYHPAGVVVALMPFDEATIDHFVFLERPEGVDLPDGAGFEPAHRYQRGNRVGRLVPNAQDYATVGHLYRGIRRGIASLAEAQGEASLFVGDPRAQVGPELMPMSGLSAVTDLASALRAIDTIVAQGEGTTSEDASSHYRRLVAVRDELRERRQANPSFAPAYPAARNPVMRRPLDPTGRVWICAEPAAAVLDTGNATYSLLLRSLGALHQHIDAGDELRSLAADLALVTMRAMTMIGELLTTLPASDLDDVDRAGLTFTISRSIHSLPSAPGALRVLAEEARLLARAHETHVAPLDARIGPLAARLARLADDLTAASSLPARPRIALPIAPAPVVPAAPVVAAAPAAPADGAQAAIGVEVARGKQLTVLFEGKRCIHSRHCVLEAPAVFLANTPGEWIFPDRMPLEALVEVAHACPSGAIRYERHDGGPAETPPPVNVVRVRENGPLAFHGALDLEGHEPMMRATLCRCGASKNKPFCDGSHGAAAFVASGEPITQPTDPLPVRDGALRMRPQKNGPITVRGNLEVCAGTGRTIKRGTSFAFCRCGGSKNKPFCDGTHASNGFTADGD